MTNHCYSTKLIVPATLLVLGMACGCRAEDTDAASEGSSAPPTELTPAPPFQPDVQDARLRAAVAQAIARSEDVSLAAVTPAAEDGVITLTGTVPDALARIRAEETAFTVPGVREVVNAVSVEVAGRPDRELVRDVMTAIAIDGAADAHEVRAVAADGVVKLNGEVQSWQEKRAAVRAALGVPGVRSVEDRIRVDVQQARPDEEIEADVASSLEWDPDVSDEQIDVLVQGGAVTLRGRVPTLAQKWAAFEDAWVAGVKSVDATPLRADPGAPAAPAQAGTRSEKEIEEAFRRTAKRDPYISTYDVRLEMHEGTAVLVGSVDLPRGRIVAERVARAIPGVASVDNRLRVVPDPRATDEMMEHVLRSSLDLHVLTRGLPIAVDVRNGVAELTGAVPSRIHADRAVWLASSVRGVRAVNSHLTVDPSVELLQPNASPSARPPAGEP